MPARARLTHWSMWIVGYRLWYGGSASAPENLTGGDRSKPVQSFARQLQSWTRFRTCCPIAWGKRRCAAPARTRARGHGAVSADSRLAGLEQSLAYRVREPRTLVGNPDRHPWRGSVRARAQCGAAYSRSTLERF